MKPRIGVSACLLGEPVRYDGGHKLQATLLEQLGGHVEWVPACPEVAIGLGVPRETIQLEATVAAVRLVSTSSRRDLTRTMRDWAAGRLEELRRSGLDGYIFKARSPSCGLGSVPVMGGGQTRDGLFAQCLRGRFPNLPVADEEGVTDPATRERFLRLARTHLDLRQLFQPGWTRGDIVGFHTPRKLLLLACSPDAYVQAGNLVGRIAQVPRPDFQHGYVAAMLQAAGSDPTPGRHANALSHAAGYFSQDLPPDERASLFAAIEQISAGDLSQLANVKRLLFATARKLGHTYLLEQAYLTACEPS